MPSKKKVDSVNVVEKAPLPILSARPTREGRKPVNYAVVDTPELKETTRKRKAPLAPKNDTQTQPKDDTLAKKPKATSKKTKEPAKKGKTPVVTEIDEISMEEPKVEVVKPKKNSKRPQLTPTTEVDEITTAEKVEVAKPKKNGKRPLTPATHIDELTEEPEVLPKKSKAAVKKPVKSANGPIIAAKEVNGKVTEPKKTTKQKSSPKASVVKESKVSKKKNVAAEEISSTIETEVINEPIPKTTKRAAKTTKPIEKDTEPKTKKVSNKNPAKSNNEEIGIIADELPATNGSEAVEKSPKSAKASNKKKTKNEEETDTKTKKTSKTSSKKPVKSADDEENVEKETTNGSVSPKPVEKAAKKAKTALNKKNPVVEKEEPKLSESDEIVVEPPKKNEKKNLLNNFATNYSSMDLSLPDNKVFNFKITSWNVAGLRALTNKGGLEFFKHELPDIFCLQEIKCVADEIPEEAKIQGYHTYWHSKVGGQSGVALYTKEMPNNIEYGLGDSDLDDDSRMITAEYVKFYVVCVYVPNSGRKLVNLEKRLKWNKAFEAHILKLNDKKPVIICGDMNVSHLEIDLANPKTNKKSAGFTQEERDGMTDLLALGFVDTYRLLYPDQIKAYTYWTYMANARAKNVGWRLDYFITSERLATKIVDNVIRSNVYGSDHCPITLFLKL